MTRSVAATVAASALLGSAALAFPVAANAAAPAAAHKPVLRLSVTQTTQGDRLQPGGAARTEIIRVTNPTGKAQTFSGSVEAGPIGAVYLRAGQLKASVTALGKTPVTVSTFQAQTPGYVGTFSAKNGKWGNFTVPAHATFAWKLSVSATKAWPMSDLGLGLRVNVFEPTRAASQYKETGFVVSPRAGGPIVEKLSGDATVSGTHMAYDTLKVTNETGADLNQSYLVQPWIKSAPGAKLVTDVWVEASAHTKGHWQRVTGALNAGNLANGHSKWFHLRTRLVSYTTKAPGVWDRMFIENWDGFQSGVSQSLLVRPRG